MEVQRHDVLLRIAYHLKIIGLVSREIQNVAGGGGQSTLRTLVPADKQISVMHGQGSDRRRTDPINADEAGEGLSLRRCFLEMRIRIADGQGAQPVGKRAGVGQSGIAVGKDDDGDIMLRKVVRKLKNMTSEEHIQIMLRANLMTQEEAERARNPTSFAPMRPVTASSKSRLKQ